MRVAPANPPAKASASAGSRITRPPIAISGRAITSHPTRNTPLPQITQLITVPGPLTKTQNTTPAISHVVPSAFSDASMRSLPVLGTSSSLPNPRHDFAVWRTCAGHGTVGGPLSETAPNCFRIRTERAIPKKSWWSAAQWTLGGYRKLTLPPLGRKTRDALLSRGGRCGQPNPRQRLPDGNTIQRRCGFVLLWHPLPRSVNSSLSPEKGHFPLCKPIKQNEFFLGATFRPKAIGTPNWKFRLQSESR